MFSKDAALFILFVVHILDTAEHGAMGLYYHKLMCQFDMSNMLLGLKAIHIYTQAIPTHHCSDVLVGFFNLTLFRGDVYERPVEQIHDNFGIYFGQLKQREEGLKVHLSVTLPEPGRVFHRMKPSARAAQEFAEKTIAVLRKYKYDGLNIFWTSSYSQDENRRLQGLLQALAKERSKSWRYRHLKFSVTFEGFPLLGHLPENVTSLHTYVDYLIVKAFNREVDSQPFQSNTEPWNVPPQSASPGDPWKSIGEHQSQKRSLRWWVDQGAPAHKLILAVPTYARVLISSTVAPQGALYPNSYYLNPIIRGQSQLCYELSEPGWKWHFHNVWLAPYYKRRVGNRTDWMFFHGEKSARAMCDPIFNYGYRGLMAWTVLLDDIENKCRNGYNRVIYRFYQCAKRHDDAFS